MQNGVLDRMRNKQRQPAADMCRLKNVLKNSSKIGPCGIVRKNTHRAVAEIQRANVVEPENVIDMAMRNKNRIEASDFCAKRLLAKIYRRIDKNYFIAMLDKDRDSESFVTRIVGKTRFAITCDRGNTSRCACSEKSEFHCENCHRDTEFDEAASLKIFVSSVANLFLAQDIASRKFLCSLSL